MTASGSCLIQLVVYGPPLSHTVVEKAQVVHDGAAQGIHDGGTEGCVPGARVCMMTCALGKCDDGFGAGVDAGLVCYGLMEDEISMRAGLAEYVAGSKEFSPIRSGEHASMEKSGPVSPVP